jgi:hypothetical protein
LCGIEIIQVLHGEPPLADLTLPAGNRQAETDATREPTAENKP